MKTYKCCECGENFEFDEEWDDEAQKEAALNFPNIPVEELAIVCDDCYEKIIKNINN